MLRSPPWALVSSALLTSGPRADYRTFLIPSGTWRSAPGTVEHAVSFALQNGYTHIDTAAGYGNETGVGIGIKASGVPRSNIFLTTKLDNPDHGNVAEALEKSLKNLGTDYLDLCLSFKDLQKLSAKLMVRHLLFRAHALARPDDARV